MSGPFQMVGAQDAPVCVDGVCALPDHAVLADAQETDEARGARGERR